MKLRSLLWTLIGLTCILRSPSVNAGQERGNGGDVLVCSRDEVTEVMFYDMYESEARFNLPPVIPQVTGLDKKVESLISRLDGVNPTRAELYRKWYATFWNEANLIPGIDLVDIPDTGSGFIPRGCHLEQLVVQKEPTFPRERRYTFSRDLWDMMNDEHRAAVVMHELILREARLPENGHETSEESRYLNAMILGNELPSLTPQQLVEVLRSLRFAQADVGGFSISICDWQQVTFLTPYQIKRASLHKHMRLVVQGRELRAENERMKNVCDAKTQYMTGLVEFYDNGQLREVILPPDLRPDAVPIRLNQDGFKGELGVSMATFDPTGKILTLQVDAMSLSGRIESKYLKYSSVRKQGSLWVTFNPQKSTTEFAYLECGNAQALIGNQWQYVKGRLVLNADGIPTSYTLCSNDATKS